MTFDPQRVQDLLAQALEMANNDQISAMLERECSAQPALRREVESLLRASRSAGVFLSQPETTDAAALNQLLDFKNLRIGNYRLISLIGEGGFGSVFLAEQEHPVRRKVALKIIKLGMDTAQVVARFQIGATSPGVNGSSADRQGLRCRRRAAGPSLFCHGMDSRCCDHAVLRYEISKHRRAANDLYPGLSCDSARA